MLARRGLRWPLRWREPPYGARRRVCCLGRRLQGRCCTRSTQATLAFTLARATLWREQTRLLLRAAATRPLPCSLDAGSAGFYTLARAILWREAHASDGGASHPVAPGIKCAAKKVASRSLPCLLNAGSAGFYAGASHPVALGGACAA